MHLHRFQSQLHYQSKFSCLKFFFTYENCGIHNSCVSKYKDYNIFFEFSKLNEAFIYTLFNNDLGLSLRHFQSHAMSSYQWHHSLQLVILVQNLKSTHDKFTISQQCNITLGVLIPSIAWLNFFGGILVFTIHLQSTIIKVSIQ
jgi:hypothetical protein